jgi:hypothetical protein
MSFFSASEHSDDAAVLAAFFLASPLVGPPVQLHVSHQERMLPSGRPCPGGIMSFGIIEVITLLLGLAGFGVQANPKAATADQALQYAMAAPDVAVHVDVASLVPGNYKLLGQLADQPQIKASPELQAMVRRAVSETEGGRSVAKMMTDIDVVSDIYDATGFFQIVPHADPTFVVAVHGKFSPSNLDKIAKLTGKAAVKLGSGSFVDSGSTEPAIALTKDGVMLFGTPDLLRARLDDGWKPPGHDASTNLGYLAEAIAAKPVFAVVLTMSTAARGEVVARFAKQNFATDMISRHKAAGFSVFHDGIGWTWVDSTSAGLDSMELVSNGLLDVLRAAQIAPRGIAKITMGALDSYRGTSAQIDDLIKHKVDIQKILEAYTGDGNFKVKSDKNVKALRLTVRATGKSISEVLPVGLLIPAAAIGFMQSQAKPEAEIAAPPPARPAARAATPATPPAPARPPVKK